MTKTTLSDDEWVDQFRTSDSGLEATATKLATRRQKEGYIPVLPVKILRAVVEAKALKALPLILAAHRQLHMAKRGSVPLTGAIWDASGYVTRKDKTAALQKLKKLPKVIRLIPKNQTLFSFYDVAYGPLWKQKGPE
jgi:hypothetical protein